MINERDRSLICPSDCRQSSLLLRETIPAFCIITSTGNHSSGFHGISSQILGVISNLADLTRPYLLRYSMIHLTDFRWTFLGDQAGMMKAREGVNWLLTWVRNFWCLVWRVRCSASRWLTGTIQWNQTEWLIFLSQSVKRWPISIVIKLYYGLHSVFWVHSP